MGKLFIVPTPIGNLEDITLRALSTLKSVDFIACEDTRHSSKLLNHFGINKPLVSYYSYNQRGRTPQIIRDILSGKDVALVSDSGTPGISDPGYLLVSEAIANAIEVVSLPGPNAAIAALVASGLPAESFVFLGFLKRKPGKLKKELLKAAEFGSTVIFYESVHRIKKTLLLCSEIFSQNSQVVLARELTKKFEEYIRGSISEVNEKLNEKEVLGEFVVMILPVMPDLENDNVKN